MRDIHISGAQAKWEGKRNDLQTELRLSERFERNLLTSQVFGCCGFSLVSEAFGEEAAEFINRTSGTNKSLKINSWESHKFLELDIGLTCSDMFYLLKRGILSNSGHKSAD